MELQDIIATLREIRDDLKAQHLHGRSFYHKLGTLLNDLEAEELSGALAAAEMKAAGHEERSEPLDPEIGER